MFSNLASTSASVLGAVDEFHAGLVFLILRCERSEPRRMDGPGRRLRGPLRGHLRVTVHRSSNPVLATPAYPRRLLRVKVRVGFATLSPPYNLSQLQNFMRNRCRRPRLFQRKSASPADISPKPSQ